MTTTPFDPDDDDAEDIVKVLKKTPPPPPILFVSFFSFFLGGSLENDRARNPYRERILYSLPSTCCNEL